MTQFLLLANPCPNINFESIKIVDVANNDFFVKVGKEVFSTLEVRKLAIVQLNGMDFDELFTNTVDEVNHRANFSDTLLYKTISFLCIKSEAIALWYASDFKNLNIVIKPELLLSEIDVSLRREPYECYAMYKSMLS